LKVSNDCAAPRAPACWTVAPTNGVADCRDIAVQDAPSSIPGPLSDIETVAQLLMSLSIGI
jgi:hypothetical protein